MVMYSGNMGLGHRFGEILEAAKLMGREGVIYCPLSGKTQDNETQEARRNIEHRTSNVEHRTSNIGQQTTLQPAPRLRFVFFGGGKRRDEVERFAREHPRAGVEIYDYAPADDLMAHLQSADVHLASLDPAWTGTMVPSKLQGIFSAARPVIFIGSAESSIGRWVRESGGGWVVAAGDVGGLLAALAEACEPMVRESCGSAAKTFAAEHFEQDRNVARVVEILTIR